MKIIHVITAFGLGGAEKLLLNIINRQIKRHSVHLIYLKPINDLIPLVDNRVSIRHIPLSFSTTYNLKSYFKIIEPDIIHTHLGHADLLGVWSSRKIDSKIFSTIHSTSFSGNELVDNLYFLAYRFVKRSMLQEWNIISISKSVQSKVFKKIDIPKNKNHLLYNAIPEIELPEKKNFNPKDISLLFIGRLTKAKSLGTLLKAVKYLKEQMKVSNFKLKIVGDGNLSNQLKQQTSRLEIKDNVSFLGEQKAVDSFYNESDIFVLPSIWEGFGIVILEAFRAKLALIASNIEGPAELIKNRENGLLFEPENHIELAQKIKLLIEDVELRERLATNGYNSFTEAYHIDTYVEKLEKLYLNA